MKSSQLSDVSLDDASFRISVFGNPLGSQDSVPIRIISKLQEEFPHINFSISDPTEYLNIEENEWWMLDIVEGIDGVSVFENIARFDAPKTVTSHDSELTGDLQLLYKLGKIRKVKIIGISPKLTEKQALSQVIKLLRSQGL